jgi:hypothetical protein
MWWGTPLILSGTGALFFWGARSLEMDGLYRVACLLLALALICACLELVAP